MLSVHFDIFQYIRLYLVSVCYVIHLNARFIFGLSAIQFKWIETKNGLKLFPALNAITFCSLFFSCTKNTHIRYDILVLLLVICRCWAQTDTDWTGLSGVKDLNKPNKSYCYWLVLAERLYNPRERSIRLLFGLNVCCSCNGNRLYLFCKWTVLFVCYGDDGDDGNVYMPLSIPANAKRPNRHCRQVKKAVLLCIRFMVRRPREWISSKCKCYCCWPILYTRYFVPFVASSLCVASWQI